MGFLVPMNEHSSKILSMKNPPEVLKNGPWKMVLGKRQTPIGVSVTFQVPLLNFGGAAMIRNSLSLHDPWTEGVGGARGIFSWWLGDRRTSSHACGSGCPGRRLNKKISFNQPRIPSESHDPKNRCHYFPNLSNWIYNIFPLDNKQLISTFTSFEYVGEVLRGKTYRIGWIEQVRKMIKFQDVKMGDVGMGETNRIGYKTHTLSYDHCSLIGATCFLYVASKYVSRHADWGFEVAGIATMSFSQWGCKKHCTLSVVIYVAD